MSLYSINIDYHDTIITYHRLRNSCALTRVYSCEVFPHAQITLCTQYFPICSDIYMNFTAQKEMATGEK